MKVIACLTGAILAAATFGFSQTGNVSVNIASPGNNARVADALDVRVNVSSLYDLSFVRATMGPLTTNLIYGGGSWTNVFHTESFTTGSYTLTVVAQDIFSNTGQAQRVIIIDRPPRLYVAAPVNHTVARSNLYISAIATDDHLRNVPINVYKGNMLLFTATNVVERIIAPFSDILRIEASDVWHQVLVQRRVYSEPSTNLTDAISTPGPLLDFSGSRTLYALIPDPPEPPVAQLFDASSGLTVTGPSIWTTYPIPGAYYEPTQGWVSPESAIVVYSSPSVQSYTFALDGNKFSELSRIVPSDVVNGVTLIGNQLYDLNKSTNGCALSLGTFRHLAANEIVFADATGVFRSRPVNPTNLCVRTVTMVSSKPANNPRTDGTNIVFGWYTNIIGNFHGEDEVLGRWYNSSWLQYTVNEGWVAFIQHGSMDQQQVWTRNPAGQIEQRTFYSISSDLESLGPNGWFTFRIYDQGGPPVGRYLSVPGSPPVWINSGQGRVKWEAGTPYVILGRSALRVALANLSAHLAGPDVTYLKLRSPIGLRYLIQESSNFATWSDKALVTNVTGVLFVTNAAPISSSKFYRASLRP